MGQLKPAGIHVQCLLEVHGPMTREQLRQLAMAQRITSSEIDSGWDDLASAGVAYVRGGRLTLRE